MAEHFVGDDHQRWKENEAQAGDLYERHRDDDDRDRGEPSNRGRIAVVVCAVSMYISNFNSIYFGNSNIRGFRRLRVGDLQGVAPPRNGNEREEGRAEKDSRWIPPAFYTEYERQQPCRYSRCNRGAKGTEYSDRAAYSDQHRGETVGQRARHDGPDCSREHRRYCKQKGRACPASTRPSDDVVG